MNVFEFKDYKKYLNHKIKEMPARGRGVRLKLSQALSCQTAYISQVLNQDTNFSLEQGIKVSDFFGHTKDETQFFLILIQLARAGNKELEKFLNNQIDDILNEREKHQKQYETTNSLAENFQHIYYSVWYYGAIHMMLTIPEFQYARKIAETLRLPLSQVNEVLEFLVETGLAKREGDRCFIGPTRIHLNKNSIQIRRHHANWRTQAISSIDKNDKDDLHYSSIISMGEKDIPIIKDILAKAIEDCRKVIKDSPEETLQAMTIDWFKVF